MSRNSSKEVILACSRAYFLYGNGIGVKTFCTITFRLIFSHFGCKRFFGIRRNEAITPSSLIIVFARNVRKLSRKLIVQKVFSCCGEILTFARTYFTKNC